MTPFRKSIPEVDGSVVIDAEAIGRPLDGRKIAVHVECAADGAQFAVRAWSEAGVRSDYYTNRACTSPALLDCSTFDVVRAEVVLTGSDGNAVAHLKIS